VIPPKPQPTLARVHLTGRRRGREAICAALIAVLAAGSALAAAATTTPGPKLQPSADGVVGSEATGVYANAIGNLEPASLETAPSQIAAPHTGLTESAVATTQAPGPPLPLRLSPCQLEHPQRLTVVAADCGELIVPENADARPVAQRSRGR
jgi:hypothetical protein